MDRVPIRYAKSGDVNVAYQVTGEGPIDLVLVHGFFSHLEVDWEHPASRRIIERLSSFSRLIRFDKRGTGLSDRSVGLPDFETRMDDMRAVMDAAGSERAVLFGYSEGGPMCVLFAATYPTRAQALVLYGTYAKRLRTEDYPWAPTWEERVADAEYLEQNWGEDFDLGAMAPNATPDLVDWAGTRGRAGLSPRGAHDLILMNSKAAARAGPDSRSPPDRRPRCERRGGPLHRRAHSRREVRRASGGRPHPAGEPRPGPRRSGGVPYGRQACAGVGARPRNGHLH
jgi:pimeloyl-ACP methyl ester carboxylesterase